MYIERKTNIFSHLLAYDQILLLKQSGHNKLHYCDCSSNLVRLRHKHSVKSRDNFINSNITA